MKLPNGNFEIYIEVEAHKMKADSLGNEIEVVINDWIDIGVFADDDETEIIFEKRVLINEESMMFTFEVATKPVKAGIDHKHLLIDRVFDDNIMNVELLN